MDKKFFIDATATYLLGFGTKKNAGRSLAQDVWANIWCAVLAERWPAQGDEWFPLCGRPMPEVLLSRLRSGKLDYTLMPVF
jgi:hypothetical protein